MATYEDDMAQAALRAVAARRVGDEAGAQFWSEQVENYNARIVLRDRQEKWLTLADGRHG